MSQRRRKNGCDPPNIRGITPARGRTRKGMWRKSWCQEKPDPGTCIRKEDDMGHTSEDRMCCDRGAATAQCMVSPPRMKSHFRLATLTGYASALPTPFKGDSIDDGFSRRQ